MNFLKSKSKQQFNIWMALLIGIGLGLVASIITVIGEINKTQSTIRAYNYIDSAGIYSLKYPAEWTLELESTFPGCDGPSCADRAPDMWLTNSRSITLISPGSSISGNGILVVAYTHQQAEDFGYVIQCEAIDPFHTVEVLKINGYDVCYDYLDWWRDDFSEGSKEHTYTYRKGDYFVSLHFIERQFQWEHIQDDSVLLPAFRAIVRSVKFLN